MKGGLLSKATLIKIGSAVLLIAAVLLLPSSQRWLPEYGLLLFGLINVLLDVPGTMFGRIRE